MTVNPEGKKFNSDLINYFKINPATIIIVIKLLNYGMKQFYTEFYVEEGSLEIGI